jgi:hypothetical protein
MCNNFTLTSYNIGIVGFLCCVCVFSLHQESPDMILGDESLISEVVLSTPASAVQATDTKFPIAGHRSSHPSPSESAMTTTSTSSLVNADHELSYLIL